MLLSRQRMLDHLDQGNIIIFPFNPRQLRLDQLFNTTSYDARLGPWYFRETKEPGDTGIFNPLDEDHVTRYWGQPQRAIKAGEWMARHHSLRNVSPEDYLILVEPGETILAHTIEFVGGRNVVTTEMRARSTWGRLGITVCKCAGWGDLGYVNRWTMEMTNHLKHRTMALPVGVRVCQIIFYQVDAVPNSSYAREAGKYQSTDDLEELRRRWTPWSMVPRLYEDRDIGHFHEHLPEDFLTSAPKPS